MNIYPSSMQERIQYVATDFLINVLTNDGPKAETLKTQCSKLAWYPTLNMGVSLPSAAAGVTAALSVSVQMTFSLRFRGVRFQGANNQLLVAGDNVIAQYGVFRATDRKTALEVNMKAGSSADFSIDMTTVAGGDGNKIVTFDSKADAIQYRDTYSGEADVSQNAGTNSTAVQSVLMNIRVNADNKNALGTTSNGVPGGSVRTWLRAGLVSEEENQQNYGLNKMVVDGSMYDPATQTINAEGYVDLNQIPDENEGETHEGDTAACTSWTTAGACVYGTEANNAQLNEINLTHAGPEFE